MTDRTLHYRGGDGQEAFPPSGGGMVTLTHPLRVQVMRGETPVPFAKIEWSVPATAQGSSIGGNALSPGGKIVLLADQEGRATLNWAIDAAAPKALHRIQAALLSLQGVVVQPVMFSAGFRLAEQVAYDPKGCPILGPVDNVQDAINGLCKHLGDQAPPSLRLAQIALFPLTGTRIDLIRDDLILNGLEVPFDAFAGTIRIDVEGGPLGDFGWTGFDPIIEVSADLPYPATDPDKAYWLAASKSGQAANALVSPFGFTTVRLDGLCEARSADATGGHLLWKPQPMAVAFLMGAPAHLWGQRVVNENQLKDLGWKPVNQRRLLIRLRIRAPHVWGEDKKTGEIVWLNAEHLGVNGRTTKRELALAQRDPQRAADLDLFFYLLLDRGLRPGPG